MTFDRCVNFTYEGFIEIDIDGADKWKLKYLLSSAKK